MDKRKIGILIMFLGLVIIGLIIFFTFFYKKDKVGVVEPDNVGQNNLPSTDNSEVVDDVDDGKPIINNQTPVQAEMGEDGLKRLAASFAERFGSYSNHSNFSNVSDLKVFMTDDMKIWADNFIKDNYDSDSISQIYYGVTTKSILVKVNEYNNNEGFGEFLVSTQRRESTGERSNYSTFNQDIIIKIKKESGMWKISEATWL